MGDNPELRVHNISTSIDILLGACEHTLNHTQEGGGHHKCEWCDARRMRKREEKERREITSIKEEKYWRHS